MTPVLMAVCLAAGFGLGWLTKRHRLGLLAENNHWVGEEIEALKGADLDADVARERALRLSGEQVDDDEWAMARMVGMVEPDDRRDGLSRSIDERWDTPACNPVVVWTGANWTVSCTCGHQDDGYDTGQAAHEAMSRHLARCGWSDGDTVCGDPAAGTVTWPEGPVDLCATHLVWAREEVER